MIRSYEVTPGVVYHAELDGPLWPRERASQAEIDAMLEGEDTDDLSAIDHLWIEETKRVVPIIHDLHIPRVPEDLGSAGKVVPMRYVVAKLSAKDKCSAIAQEVVRSTWLYWVATEDERGIRSLAQTARYFGISPSTARQRLNHYKSMVAEKVGANKVERMASFGSFVSRVRRKAA